MSDHSQQQLAHELKTELPQFRGDGERYRHSLNRQVIYTPGVQYLAERAGAYWLVDAIAIHLSSTKFRRVIQNEPRILDLHFWRLDVSDDATARLNVCRRSCILGPSPCFLNS